MKRLSTWLLAMLMALTLIPANVSAQEGDPAGTEPGNTETVEEMTSASIGGLTYFYTDTEGDDPATVYQATVSGRAGSTVYTFAKADMMQVTGTEYYYTTVTGVTPLSGTLYGYTTEGSPATYASVYGSLGVETDDTYDAISSATKYTGHHAKDIPSMVTFGSDAAGDKAITGLNLARKTKTVDALTFVEANILKAAGQPLSDQQEATLDITLKANPMNAPANEKIVPKLASAEYTSSSRYGLGEFDIIPDDTVAGYVWSEYWGSVYAATISDGTKTVGAVHWIDLYGEAAVSGPHYNKIQIALNNGTSTASNAATVTRYAAFFDENNELKAGTYTINIYAEGYDVLEAEVKVYTAEENQAAADTQKAQEEADKKKAEEEAKKAADEAARRAAEARKVKKGDRYVVSGQAYKVTKAASAKTAGTVTFTKAKNARNITVPASVKLKDGKSYTVTQIGAKAFAQSKAVKITVKTGKLTKKTVKNSLKGSKVKTVSVKVGNKKANNTYVKKYKKIFTKKNAGKKVTVK